MPELARLHTRPRLIELCSQPQHLPRQEVRGGLTPAVLKRVLDYIETHFDENIELATLAATAELSLFHFARAFKISKGTTPHSYILHRRIERAQRLLRETNLPQAEIARLSGFSDQSHLARRFREFVGVSPKAFRLSSQ
jgi:AraC family transcriptional regulator